jgi:DNA-directed RNA polymerase subunit H (RpoH/RPB5)
VSEASLNQLNPSVSNSSEATEADPAISRLKNLWIVLSEEERTQLLKELGLEKNLE